MRLAGAFVLGLAVGAVLGWTLAAAKGAAPLVSVAVNPSPSPLLAPQAPPEARTTLAPAATPVVSPPSSPVPATPREAELEARIKSLERELASERADAQDAAGAPLRAPPNLLEKYGQASLMAAVNDACRSLDPAPQVTAVDCGEYPCIVYGTGMTSADAKLFEQAASLKTYTTNGSSHFASTSDGDFAFTALPQGDPNAIDNRDKRLATRIQQMFVETRKK